MGLKDTVFKVLNWVAPLWIFLVVFAIIGIIAFTLFLMAYFNKKHELVFDKSQVNVLEFKRLEKFENQRNDFEMELAKVRKLIKTKK